MLRRTLWRHINERLPILRHPFAGLFNPAGVEPYSFISLGWHPGLFTLRPFRAAKISEKLESGFGKLLKSLSTLHFQNLFTPHASRLTPHASRLTPHASRLTPHASRLTPHASRLTPHASRLTPHASRLTPHASRLTPHASRLTPSFLPVFS